MRTKRDNQQWMLDLALNMRGRVSKETILKLQQELIITECFLKCGGKKLNMMKL